MRQVLRPGALGRPRGIGWRGRWEGGPGWGLHVNPWLILVAVCQDPLQCCKVISLQLIKITEKKMKATILKFLWNRTSELPPKNCKIKKSEGRFFPTRYNHIINALVACP